MSIKVFKAFLRSVNQTILEDINYGKTIFGDVHMNFSIIKSIICLKEMTIFYKVEQVWESTDYPYLQLFI